MNSPLAPRTPRPGRGPSAGLCAALALALLTALGPRSARAQTFPPDSAFTTQPCGGGLSFDPVRDVGGAVGERDIVGAGSDAAVYYASDGTYLFLRIRLGDTPLRNDGTWKPFGWGFEIDTDHDLNTYEYLILIDGIANPDQVVLAQNTVTGTVGDPGDHAEVELRTYPAATHAQATVTTSALGGTTDYFATVAIPIADLIAVGVPMGYAIVWSGTSANAQSLSVDLACHDGNTGAPVLSAIPVGAVGMGVAVSITSPAAGATVHSPTPLLAGAVTQGASVSVVIDAAAPAAAMTDGAGHWSLVPASPLAPGAHALTVTATDIHEHASTASGTFTVSNGAPPTPPSLAITAPSDGALLADAAPSIGGTTDPLASVDVSLDGAAPVTVAADASGRWVLPPSSTLAQGPHTVSATTTNAAELSTTTAIGFTVDTVAPAVGIATPANGALLAASAVVLSGSAEPLASVALVLDAAMSASTSADAAGLWSLASIALPDGPHTLVATARDAAGNAASTSSAFTVDTTPPAVAIASPADGSTGRVDPPVISGSTEPGASVAVAIDGAPAGAATVGPTGAWTFAPGAALGDGPHAVRATATDAADNSASASSAFALDGTPPPLAMLAPVNGETVLLAQPTIHGQTEPGASVNVAIDGAAPVSASVDPTGSFALVVPVALASGTHSASASARDAVGNESDATVTFDVDTNVPTLAIAAPAPGTLSANNLLPLAGLTQPGASVVLAVDGSPAGTLTAGPTGAWRLDPVRAWTEGRHDVLATTTDRFARSASASTDFTVDTTPPSLVLAAPRDGALLADRLPVARGTTDPGARLRVSVDEGTEVDVSVGTDGAWQFVPPAPLADGPHAVRATALDALDNAVSARARFTIDATAPALAIAAPRAGSTTRERTPTLRGTTDPLLLVVLTLDAAPAVSVRAEATGAWTLEAPIPLVDGPHVLLAQATDAAGNRTESRSTFTVTSSAPAVAIDFPEDGAAVADRTPIVRGTTSPHATVSIALDNGAAVAVTADALGAYVLPVGAPLAEGPHRVRAEVSDALATSAAQTDFVVDTTAPAVRITTPAEGSVTADTLPPVAGGAEPLARVEFAIDGASPTALRVSADGTWSGLCPAPLGEGTHHVVARAMDAAGNSATSATTFAVDLTAPALTITAPSAGSVTRERWPAVYGTTDPDMVVQVTIDGAAPLMVVADADGRWRVAPGAALENGSHTARAEVADAAGNRARASTTFTVNDRAPPVALRDPADGSVLATTRPPVAGTTDPGLAVTLSVDALEFGTVLVGADGAFAAALPGPLTDGAHVVTATARSTAGVTASATSRFVVDTLAPDLAVDAPVEGAIVREPTPRITGRAAPRARVSVALDGAAPVVLVADATGAWSLLPASTLGDGPHRALALAADDAGNRAQVVRTFRVELGACASNAECGGATPVCDVPSGACRACVVDADCGGLTPACGPTGACVPCTVASAGLCTGATPACGAARACVQCTGANSAACSGATPVCGPQERCVQCTADDSRACLGSAAGSACLADHACGCRTDADCDASHACDGSTARCVARSGPSGETRDAGAADAGAADASRAAPDPGAGVTSIGGGGFRCHAARSTGPARGGVRWTALLALLGVVAWRRRASRR